MDVWLTFFALVVGGGLALFLFLRRGRPEPPRLDHSLDQAPPLNGNRGRPTRR